MKIILLKDVQNLGEEGDVLQVKNGYASNYLIPKGFAVLFNNQNLSILNTKIASIKKRKEQKKLESRTQKEKIDDFTLNIYMQSGEKGRLYGSLTNLIVSEKLKEELDINIPRKQIEIPKNYIKSLGLYRLKIKLYENSTAILKVNIHSNEKKDNAEEEIEEVKEESSEE